MEWLGVPDMSRGLSKVRYEGRSICVLVSSRDGIYDEKDWWCLFQGKVGKGFLWEISVEKSSRRRRELFFGGWTAQLA